MSSVVISGDTSGAITLSAPAVAGTNTATLPAATGTVMVSGNIPSFRAYSVVDQSITNGVYAKIQLSTTDFDTATAFNTTLYRYVAPVAGYYYVVGNCYLANSVAGTDGQIAIYKNGSLWQIQNIASTSRGIVLIAGLVYMNGSTDYVELWGRQNNATGPTIYGDSSAAYTSFAGSLVRTA
jgi:hypothetical protein